MCHYKNWCDRINFDSFGQITPVEIQKYLDTRDKYESWQAVIQRNTDIVQRINTDICDISVYLFSDPDV